MRTATVIDQDDLLESGSLTPEQYHQSAIRFLQAIRAISLKNSLPSNDALMVAEPHKDERECASLAEPN